MDRVLQDHDVDILDPNIFILKKHLPIKCTYTIYNQKHMALVRVSEKRAFRLEDTSYQVSVRYILSMNWLTILAYSLNAMAYRTVISNSSLNYQTKKIHCFFTPMSTLNRNSSPTNRISQLVSLVPLGDFLSCYDVSSLGLHFSFLWGCILSLLPSPPHITPCPIKSFPITPSRFSLTVPFCPVLAPHSLLSSPPFADLPPFLRHLSIPHRVLLPCWVHIPL